MYWNQNLNNACRWKTASFAAHQPGRYSIGGTFTAKDIPPILVLPEHHDGLDAASRNVVYALHTLLHHTNNHFTAHGFVANGDNEPYVFFHDGMARPMARPAQRNGQGELSYPWKVFRAWYKRIGLE